MEKWQDLIEPKAKTMRILMVSVEYPPIRGGIGRYTYNLTKNLMKLGCEVYVACNKKGHGQFFGLSPTNVQNSDILLKIVDKSHPDIVHVQYEHGSYGLKLDPINPRRISTNIDSFYERCKTPIVTTFHSSYNFKQWLRRVEAVKSAGQTGKLGTVFEYWKYILNYNSLHKLDKRKLKQSQAGIVFSHYMAKLVGGGELIYHGAQPNAISNVATKREARRKFSIPKDGRIALAVGFRTAVKGWDILENMQIPEGWNIIINSSKNEYGLDDEKIIPRLEKKAGNIVCLQKGFLSDEDLSLLLYAADALILPYKVSSGSGVMFDGLAHGLPFVATDLGFFKEFSSKGLGITVKRSPAAFANALRALDKYYEGYLQRVSSFKEKLKWDIVAEQHASIYRCIIDRRAPLVAGTSDSKA
jgi:glycosyltransferase involved in cell wall biosynthesis